MRTDIYRTSIFKEFDKETNKKYFDTKGNSVLENVDTLYYNVFLSNDCNEDLSLKFLFQELDILKDLYKDTKDIQTYKELQVMFGSYSIYNYRLSSSDLFDIFISDYLPNTKTARIVIQLRSFGLWVHGVDKMLELSFSKLKEILNDFNVSVDRTLENRFDYCYHTNMIQNGYKFFSDDKLKKHLCTTMNTYSKVGDINVNDGILTIDYFSLGHRNSNNVFIRIYNKTREVIEMGYKSFFIELWYQNKMISFYDKYCIEFAYKNKNYAALDLARLHFYLDYGSDFELKKQITKLISDKNSRYKDYKELADKYLPQITIVNNIEFETKRRFYYFSDKQIDILKTDCCSELKRIYQIYHNRDIFLNYLTSTTLYFVNNRNDNRIQSWWSRIQNKKLSNCLKSNSIIVRDYSKNIDFKSALTRSINAIGTASIYKNKIDTDLVEDFSCLLGILNDNDISNIDSKIAFVNSDTGEVIQYLDEKISVKYKEDKQKKYSQLKNRISSSLPDPQKQSID